MSMARRPRTGFTLIEMLVVLSVIGLLLSITAPTYLAHVDRARDLALKQNLRTVRDGIDKFSADRGRAGAHQLA
jgi:general secretion pathway protein G